MSRLWQTDARAAASSIYGTSLGELGRSLAREWPMVHAGVPVSALRAVVAATVNGAFGMVIVALEVYVH